MFLRDVWVDFLCTLPIAAACIAAMLAFVVLALLALGVPLW